MSEVVSSADFEGTVLKAGTPVLVDFFAVWCGPCQRVAPILDEVAAEVAGKAKVVKLDIDASPEIASRYGVTSVPTMMLFVDGKPVKQMVGAQPKEQILAFIG